MSKQSKIYSFFKAKTADELEVEELLFTQASRASRATTMETSKSINSISTSIRSIIDLSQNNDSSDVANIASLFQQYDSDSDNLELVDDDVVEYMGVVTNNSSVGDVIIRALDTLICPSVLPVTFVNNEPLYKKVKRYRTTRPNNWRLIAEYYKENRNAAGTIRHFNLGEAGVVRTIAYWTTTIGRWVHDIDNVTKNLAYRRVACYGAGIDLALKNIVIRYNEHAVPITHLILRLQLLTLLQADNRDDILDCIAGPTESISKMKPYRFDRGWAQRL